MSLVKLEYGVLALLAQKNLSGYDITQKINQYWKTTHSRIYPILSKLDKSDYVFYQKIEQNGKPDKKLYSITKKGKQELMNWITQPTQAPIIKDENMLKFLCISFLDKKIIIKLLKNKIESLEKSIKNCKTKLLKLKVDCNNIIDSKESLYFSEYVLLEITSAQYRQQAEWCKWLYSIYKRSDIKNYLDIKFN